MTWYYVYAIVPGTISLPNDLRGITDETLFLIGSRALAAVVGECSDQSYDPVPSLVLSHHRVVARICEQSPALPVQFGSRMNGQDSLRTALDERYDAFSRDLERLAGKVEYGITVPMDDDTSASSGAGAISEAPAQSGADYMRRRLSEYQRENQLRTRAERIRDELDEVLGTLASEWHEETMPRPGIMFRGSYLVDESMIEDFRQSVDQFRQRNSGVEAVVVGPWPPYSFVSSTGHGPGGMYGANSS